MDQDETRYAGRPRPLTQERQIYVIQRLGLYIREFGKMVAVACWKSNAKNGCKNSYES